MCIEGWINVEWKKRREMGRERRVANREGKEV